jgi:hypothetical protein
MLGLFGVYGFALAQNIPLVTANTSKAGTVYSVPVQTFYAHPDCFFFVAPSPGFAGNAA